MPWTFLLLVMLNGVYFVWHLQEAPLRPKEVEPLLTHRAYGQGIRLLSESGLAGGDTPRSAEQEKCLYLGGVASPAEVGILGQRLVALDIDAQPATLSGLPDSLNWLKVSPASRRLINETLLAELRSDFPKLKSEIMSCVGIATAD